MPNDTDASPGAPGSSAGSTGQPVIRRVVALLTRSAVFPQLLRYGAASAVALAADYATLYLLASVIGLPPLLANSVSFTVGVVITYFASRMWVFSERRLTDPRAEFVVFVLVGLAGLAVNDGVVWAGTTLGWNLYVAKALAAAVSFVWNFFLRKYLIYR